MCTFKVYAKFLSFMRVLVEWQLLVSYIYRYRQIPGWDKTTSFRLLGKLDIFCRNKAVPVRIRGANRMEKKSPFACFASWPARDLFGWHKCMIGAFPRGRRKRSPQINQGLLCPFLSCSRAISQHQVSKQSLILFRFDWPDLWSVAHISPIMTCALQRGKIRRLSIAHCPYLLRTAIDRYVGCVEDEISYTIHYAFEWMEVHSTRGSSPCLEDSPGQLAPRAQCIWRASRSFQDCKQIFSISID